MMDAGRELDAAVAEKVMGSKLVACMQCADWHLDLDVPNACNWSPSTDIAAAWAVVEKMMSQALEFRLKDKRGGYQFKLYDISGTCVGKAWSASVTNAICLAALKAVGYNPTPSP